MHATRHLIIFLIVICFIAACGPVPRPKGAYTSGADILGDVRTRRDKVTSFRITGRVDHFGEDHRVQGKVYLFAELPQRLRIELVSPFGNALTVLTVDKGRFALNDLREGRFLTGPAEPCNIARLVRIPLPPDDVMRVLIGHTPIIEGDPAVRWDTKGVYRVDIVSGDQTQRLEIGPDKGVLPLLASSLSDRDGTVFTIGSAKWRVIDGVGFPHEIRVKMPRHEADLLLRYDEGGVELNVPLPDDAWQQTPPPGIEPEQVHCDDRV
ncbi:MAG: hypothetical protein QNJ97_06970 [Myxococcota bacterium]|nr:hypothetical protein [Myxococcota bacterium]